MQTTPDPIPTDRAPERPLARRHEDADLRSPAGRTDRSAHRAHAWLFEDLLA